VENRWSAFLVEDYAQLPMDSIFIGELLWKKLVVGSLGIWGETEPRSVLSLSTTHLPTATISYDPRRSGASVFTSGIK